MKGVLRGMRVYPTPSNLSYEWCFGFLSLLFMGVQLVSGVCLTFHYVADIGLAWESIRMLMTEVPYGWLLRYVHANGASFFFFCVYVHMFRGMYYGSYLFPREGVWYSGIVIYVLLFVIAFLGYVLPWGQMSYWGATVISGLIGVVPIVGDDLLRWLWAGDCVSSVTLRRFFTLHWLLSFLLLGVVMLHIVLLHEVGSSNPEGVETDDYIAFHPYFSLKDLVAFLGVLFFFLFFVFFAPFYFGNPVNELLANPGVTPKKIVPEWYLLPLYTILRSIESRIGGLLLIVLAIVVLVGLPTIQLGVEVFRSGRGRPLYTFFFVLFVWNCLLMGWVGSQVLVGGWILLTKLTTFYFFFYLVVVIRCLGLLERYLLEIV